MPQGRLELQPGILALLFWRGIRAFRIMVDCQIERPVVGQTVKLPVALAIPKNRTRMSFLRNALISVGASLATFWYAICQTAND